MRVISKTIELEQYCNELISKKPEFITIDTEFIREKSYKANLCLIQIATSNNDAVIIDVLAKDLAIDAIYEILNKSNIIKVFHSARQDIEIFVGLTGKIPSPIFDTQIAAMVCGFGDQVSYQDLVHKVLNQQICKSMRFTKWDKRPLSNEQLSYAISDVTYLCDVYEHLKHQLKTLKRESWISDEMDILYDKNTYEVDSNSAWKKAKLRGINNNNLGVFISLAKWREDEAKSQNRPRLHIATDDFLQQLAATQPTDMEQLKRLRGYKRGKHSSEQLNSLLSHIMQGQKANKSSLPKLNRPKSISKGNLMIIELLKTLLKIRSNEENLSSKLICSAKNLEELVTNRNDKNSNQSHILRGWRYNVFGKYALELMEGKSSLKVRGGKVILSNEGE